MADLGWRFRAPHDIGGDSSVRFVPGGQSVDAPPAATAPVILLGRDYPELSEIGIETVGTRIGMALSRGELPKAYWHLDPNEDGVLAAEGRGGVLLAVVDGHTGADAAEAALAGVASACPALEDSWSAPETVVQWAVDAARVAVAERLAEVSGVRRGSRTALAIALVSGDTVCTASYGDASIVRVRRRRVHKLSSSGPFLGPRSPAVDVHTTKLHRRERIVLASDGFTDFVGADLSSKVARAFKLAEPGQVARQLVDDAFAGGAGDNVAVVVLSQ